jgi:hypothetical protein
VTRKLALLFLLTATLARAQSYTTTFPATENPISQGGNWINGLATGLDWGNVQSTPGLAFGTTVSGAPPYNDSIAALAGSWPTNQSACATVAINSSFPNRNSGPHEVEVHLHRTITAHSSTGYEFNYGLGTTAGAGFLYLGIVRWNGPLNNFTGLTNTFTGTPPVLQNGDVFCAANVGATLTGTVTRAGTVIATWSATDSTYTGGSPGIGMYNQFGAGDNPLYGFSSFTTPSSGGPATYTASSCNQGDVNEVINGTGGTTPPIVPHHAIDGDIINIPAGSCTWTAPIAVNSNIGITITGAGTPNSAASAVGASASCSSTALTMNFVGPALSMAPTFGNSLSRISCIYFIPGPNYTGSPGHGIAGPLSIFGTCTAAGCPNLRLDNLTFLTVWTNRFISDGSMMNVADVFGVGDHNTIGDTINTSDYIDGFNVGHGLWLGNVAFGDSSWASPDTFGTNQMFYLENNLFSHALGTDTDIPDPSPHGGGARFACRFNTFNNLHPFGACTGHGTETTGRPRGARQWEGYFNTAVCTDTTTQGCGSLWPGRSGVGRSFGNKVSDSGAGRMKALDIFNAQRSWRGSADFGFCGGLAPWDTNDTNGGGGNVGHVYFTGTVASVSGLAVTVNGTPGWATNQWAPSGANYSVIDVTGGSFSAEIESNTANSFTIEFSSSGSNFVIGDTVEITRAFVCMDQSNRGQGVLLNGQHTPNQVQVSEVLDPSYEADDDARGTLGAIGVYFASAQHREIENRDWYQEVLNQNAQTSATSPFNGTSGTGHGTLALRPTTCTTGVGYWATDQGNWNLSGVAGPRGYMNGVLYICTATNVWTLSFTPGCYPHALITGSPCSGVAPAPVANLSPSSLSFGNVLVGSTSAAQNITLSNTGTAALLITSIAPGGTSPADFSQTNNCSGSVAVGGSCIIAVKFTPLSAATFSANITVTDNAAGSPHTASLSGTGITATAGISFSPTSLTFSSQTVGTSSSPQAVTVTNTGSANLVITAITPTGGSSTSFSQTNNCGTVAASGTCTINVTFTPQAAGALASQICVTDNAPASPQCFNISGTGTATGNIGFNPASLTFPNTAVGVTSAALPITVRNSGGSPITISSIVASGDFAQSNNCGTSLAAGGSCTVSVTFHPTTNGTRTGAITFTDSAPGSPQTVSLQGVGFTPAPQVTLSMATVTFGNQTTGTSSNPQVVIVTNTGTASLSISATSITGTNSGDFGQSSTCGGTLAVNASCTYSFVFTPTAAGSRTATFNLTTNAPSSVDHVSLSGTGVSSPNGAPAPQVFGD